MYYTVYVGGERKNRPNTDADAQNVERMLHTMDNCWTAIMHNDHQIAQAEHVLPLLISISFITGKDDLARVLDLLRTTGITTCTIAKCEDKDCQNEMAYTDITL